MKSFLPILLVLCMLSVCVVYVSLAAHSRITSTMEVLTE